MISCQFSKSNVHMNLFICTIWEVKCRLHSSFSLNKYTCSLHLQNEFYHHGGCVKVYLFTLNISGHLQAYIHIIFNITYFSHVQCMTFKKIAKNDDVRFLCLIIYQQWYFPRIILKIRIIYILIFSIPMIIVIIACLICINILRFGLHKFYNRWSLVKIHHCENIHLMIIACWIWINTSRLGWHQFCNRWSLLTMSNKTMNSGRK